MPEKNKVIEKLMGKTDIPGLSMATMKNGVIDYTALGMTSCGFYKVNQLPNDEQMTKLDSSRYLLTDDDGLYFYNVSTNRLETVSEYDVIVKNTMDMINQDPMYQKYNQIPALKAHQLEHIKRETGHQFQPKKIDKSTQFGAASLSKPVFFYLVLRIIEDKNLQKELGLEHFDLNTKLVDLLPGFAEKSGMANDITVGMVLSHQTGIHDPSQDYGAPEILFEPGSQFGYSGFPLIYLQMALEKNTGRTLEHLAQKYVFEPCHMDNSSFLKKGYEDLLPDYSAKSSVFPADIDSYSSIAANSLRTIAEDYAKFMLKWMNDEKLSKYLTTPVVKLTSDGWARSVGIEKERLNNLAWGHGIGLQLEKNEVTALFHNGDMNQWRAVITMNPQTKTGTVFFSNSHNGDVLTQEVTNGVINARESCEYMRDKFGFAMAYEEDWEAKQMSRMKNINLVIVGKSLEAAKLNLDRATGQLQKAQIEKARERYLKTQKMLKGLTAERNEPKDSHKSTIDDMIDRARKNEPESDIAGASEDEWAQKESDYKSSYSLMNRTLTQHSPRPISKATPKNEKDKKLNQPQRKEGGEHASTTPSEYDSHKPMTPFDDMYVGPGHDKK